MSQKIQNYFIVNEEDGITLLFLSEFMDIFPMKINQKLLSINLFSFAEFVKGHVRYCLDKDNYKNAGQEVLDNIIKDPGYVKTIRKKVKESADKLIGFSKKIKNLELKNLSNQEISKLFSDRYKLTLKMIAHGMLPTIMEISNDLLSNYLKDLLKRHIDDSVKISEKFLVLTESSFAGVGQDLKNDALKEMSESHDLEMIAQRLADKYFWMKFEYGEGEILDKKYFLELLKKEYSGINPEEELKKLESEEKNIIDKRKKVEKELNLSNEEKRLFEVARDAIFIKLYRRDALIFSIAIMQRVLEEINERTGYSILQIRHCLYSEIEKLFEKNDAFKKELDQRIERAVFSATEEGSIILTGKQAEEFVNQALPKEDFGDIKEIKGSTACLGKAIGRVSIINIPEEMEKMEEGNILVATATIPQIVPAMKKAGAIITDIGGITSHAAIVSREMKKPCIIGTKIATKVLKDGDEVEVDANKGVVKIIKKAK